MPAAKSPRLAVTTPSAASARDRKSTRLAARASSPARRLSSSAAA